VDNRRWQPPPQVTKIKYLHLKKKFGPVIPGGRGCPGYNTQQWNRADKHETLIFQDIQQEAKNKCRMVLAGLAMSISYVKIVCVFGVSPPTTCKEVRP
jgi:hypothetical protein